MVFTFNKNTFEGSSINMPLNLTRLLLLLPHSLHGNLLGLLLTLTDQILLLLIQKHLLLLGLLTDRETIWWHVPLILELASILWWLKVCSWWHWHGHWLLHLCILGMVVHLTTSTLVTKSVSALE